MTAITNEAATPASQAWLAAHAADDLLISQWVTAEVSSALSIKLRRGDIDLAQRAAALAQFRGMIPATLNELPVLTPHFQAAALAADNHVLGLRASDALHLAICADQGASLVTLDRRLLDAAPALGVAVEAL